MVFLCMRRNMFGIPPDIVWATIAAIKPGDIIRGEIPLSFFDADVRVIVAEAVDKISEVVSRFNSYLDTVLVPIRFQNKTAYYVNDDNIAYAIDLAQSFIIKGLRDNTYRTLWILHTLIYQEVGDSSIEINIDSAIANGYPETMSRDEFRDEFTDSLVRILRGYGISITISNHLIRMKREEAQKILFIVFYMAWEAHKEIKYVRPLLKLLCREIGPLRRSDVKSLLSQKLLSSRKSPYKPDSIRVKILHPAKKYGYIREIIAPDEEEILVPNCEKCIFYAKEELCRSNVLGIIRDRNLKTKLSKKPTYILNTIAIYLQKLNTALNSIATLFTYVNIGLQLMGEQDLVNDIKTHTIEALQNLETQINETPSHA
jgi:hypothetical protein